MKFSQTPLAGAFQIDLDKRMDERGFFARSYCEKEYQQHGLEQHFVQMNHSLSVHKGTLRGLHYQLAPMEEVKVVRCVQGRIWDCILDLRPTSATFGKWVGLELTDRNYTMLYIPRGCAHGFISLEDHSEILYQVSQFYSPQHERCVRWNDPAFSIAWPMQPTVLSERDSKQSDFSEDSHLRLVSA